MLPRTALLPALFLALSCGDSGPKVTRDRGAGQVIPDTYLYLTDGPRSIDTDGKPRTPDGPKPLDTRPPDGKPPPDTKPPLDLNCVPAGYDKCTTSPTNCCGGLACCVCACGNFCRFSASISCQNVCINVC